MLRWAMIFLVIAIVAAVLGFGSIAGAATDIAIFLFWAFLIITVLFFILGMVGGRKMGA